MTPERTKNHDTFITRKLPQSYPLTDQQLKFKQITEECGIVKGVSRADLINAMKNCVPEKWRQIKEAEKLGSQPLSAVQSPD